MAADNNKPAKVDSIIPPRPTKATNLVGYHEKKQPKYLLFVNSKKILWTLKSIDRDHVIRNSDHKQ
jgi:hypothetical protein